MNNARSNKPYSPPARHVHLTYPGVPPGIWKCNYDVDKSITLKNVTLTDTVLAWYVGEVDRYLSVTDPACPVYLLSRNFFVLYFDETYARATSFNANYNMFVHVIMYSKDVI